MVEAFLINRKKEAAEARRGSLVGMGSESGRSRARKRGKVPVTLEEMGT